MELQQMFMKGKVADNFTDRFEDEGSEASSLPRQISDDSCQTDSQASHPQRQVSNDSSASYQRFSVRRSGGADAFTRKKLLADLTTGCSDIRKRVKAIRASIGPSKAMGLASTRAAGGGLPPLEGDLAMRMHTWRESNKEELRTRKVEGEILSLSKELKSLRATYASKHKEVDLLKEFESHPDDSFVGGNSLSVTAAGKGGLAKDDSVSGHTLQAAAVAKGSSVETSLPKKDPGSGDMRQAAVAKG